MEAGHEEDRASVLRCKKHTSEVGSGVVRVSCDCSRHRASLVCLFFVGIRDGDVLYCDDAPPEQVLRCFKDRGDNHIMSLELLARAFGMLLFLFMQWTFECCFV